MRKKKNKTENQDLERKLRDKAEEKLALSTGTPGGMQEKTLEEVIHELQVHQIELEMQNDELRKAQLALEESRQRYADLYDFAPVGYITFNPEALIKEVNLSGAMLLGVARQKLINRRFRSFIAPSDFDLWDQYILRVLQQGEKQTCDLRLKRQDGSPFFAGLESIRMEVSRGAFEVHTTITDITTRKQAEEGLRLHEALYNGFINSMNSGVAVYRGNEDGSDFVFFDFNKAGEKIDKVKKEDLLGKSVLEIFPKIKEFGLFEIFQRVWKTGRPERLSETFYLDERISGWRENYVYKLPSGEIVALYDDITERVQAEMLLRESEEKYRSLASTADLMYLVDRKCRYLFTNEKYSERLNLREAQIIGRMYSEFHSEEDTKEFAQKVKEVFDTNKSIQSEHKSERDQRYFLRTYSPVIDQDGKAIMAVTVVSKDITERKWAEEKLNEANLRLQMLQQITASVHSTLDLEEVFKQITDSFVYSMGYNSALIIKRSDKINQFEVKALSSQRWVITEVDKILGFPLINYSFSIDPGLNAAVSAAMGGEIVVAKTAEELVYPLINKTTCSMLQELGGIKNYILVPLQVDQEVVGGVIITSAREEVSEEEIKMVNIFAQAASHAIQNANLHILTQQAKEALRQSEENFKALAENATDGILIGVGEEGRHVYANRRAVEITGYPIEELVKTRIRDLAPPDELSKLTERYKERLAGLKAPKPYETALVNKDGLKVPIEISPSKTTWQNQPADMIILRDITERKRAEEALRKSEEKFRNLFDNAVEGVFQATPEGRLLTANRAFARMFGYESPEENINTVTDISHQMYANPVDRETIIGTLKQRGYLKNFECQMRRKDGRIFWGSIHSRFTLTVDGIPCFEGFLTDITERKQLEEILRQSEERYRTVIEEIDEGYYEVDLAGNFTFVNDAMIRQLQYSREELIGMNYRTFLSQDDSGGVNKAFDQVYRTGEIIKWNPVTNIRKDGKPIFLENSIACRRDKEGRIIGFRGICLDVSERKRAEEMLQASETKYRIVADNTYDWEFWRAPEGRLLYISPSCKRITGHAPDEFTSDPELLYHIIHPDDRPDYDRHRNEERQKMAPCELEFRIIRPDGTVRWIDHLCQPVFAPDGHFLGTRGNNRDITESKQAEDALRESEVKYRILASSQDAMYFVDRECRYLFMNGAHLLRLGLSLDEVVGRSYSEFHSGEDTIRFADRVTAVFATGKAFQTEYRSERDKRYFLQTFSPVKDLKGNITGVTVISKDITERKQAEEALRESEKKYRLIVENSRDIIFTLGSSGEFIYLSPSISNVLGYDQSELIGHKFHTLIHPEDLPAVQDVLQRSMEEGFRTHGTKYRIRHASGEWRWYTARVNTVRDEKGNFLNVTGVAQDITERKKAEEGIKKAEEKYRSIFENAIEGIFQTTPDGRFISANKALAYMLGYNSPEELIRSITNLMNQIYVDPDRRAELRRIFKSQDKVEGFEYEAYRKDGQVIWISNNMRAVRNEKGELLFYEGTGIDITEKKNLQTEIMQADRLSTIGELAAGVAHEINNPINGIINYAQMLIDQEQGLGGENDIPQRIIKEGERIASIVNNLLKFSKDRRENPRPIPIQTPLDGVLELMGTQMKKDGIRITVKLLPDLPQVKVNSQQIQQVFLNLLSNTRYALNQKYPGDHPGKTLNISSKKIINKQGRPQIRLTFQDAGTGIPKAFLDKIFDPFFSTKLAEKGTGLGLSISRKIIQDHGGRLWLESREGEYTKAIVELPAAE